MITITLPDSTNYHDIYSLANIPQGTSLIICNNTNSQIRIFQGGSPEKNDGFPVWPNHTALVHGNDVMECYVKGSTSGYIVVQQLTSTVGPFTNVELPQDIVTSGKEGFRRLQVDQGQTGFFEAREFRVIRKLRLATSETKIFKFTCNVDFILSNLHFTVSTGNFEFHIWTANNVEETVLSTTPVPFIQKNESSEFRDYDGGRYQSETTILTGGSIAVTNTDMYRDYGELITAGATAQRVTVSGSTTGPRYLPAATFFVEIFAINGPVRGTIAADWEERPPGVK